MVAFTTSPDKAVDARRLGAHEVVLSRDEAQVAAQASRLDLILDTVSTTHPMDPYIRALRLDGTLCSLGIPDRFDSSPVLLTVGRRSLASSGAGGTRDAREMLAFCAEHGITADVEVIAPGEFSDAFGRLARNDVRYRFVVDMARDDAPSAATAADEAQA